MTSDKYWKMLDTDHPEYVEEVVGLVNWSHNCERPTPFDLYLDLIGWSAEELGEHLWQQNSPSLDYRGLGYLADALQEYVKRPADVCEWVTKLQREGSE
jgi:hypothetical protein